jgi:hypothetical protein
MYNDRNPHPYVIRIRMIKFKICLLVIKRATFSGAVSVMHFMDRNRSKNRMAQIFNVFKNRSLFVMKNSLVFYVLENSA